MLGIQLWLGSWSELGSWLGSMSGLGLGSWLGLGLGSISGLGYTVMCDKDCCLCTILHVLFKFHYIN